MGRGVRRSFPLLAGVLWILLCAGCGLLPGFQQGTEEMVEEPTFPAGEQMLPVWQYEFWLTQAKETLRNAMEAEPDWRNPKLQEKLKRQALADTALCAVVDDWASRWRCDGVETLGTGAMPALASLPADPDHARVLAGTVQKYRNLQALAAEPESPMRPELDAFAAESGFLTVDRILTTGADAESRANALFAALNRGGDFASLAAKGDDHTGPRSLLPGDGTLDPALEAAAAALEPGQHSGLLASKAGRSILLRLPPDRTVLAALWLDQTLLKEASDLAVAARPPDL